MDNAEQTMINNLLKNTGKSLEQWIKLVQRENFTKHGEYLKFLKEKHGLTHGFANLVAMKARKADAGSVENKDDLIESQYKGKEDFRPLYDALIEEIKSFGNDVEIAPKKAYVSLRRKKQFAMLQPATKTRFEISVNLKGVDAAGILEEVKTANAMCSHVIKLESITELNAEVMGWLKQAYEEAG